MFSACWWCIFAVVYHCVQTTFISWSVVQFSRMLMMHIFMCVSMCANNTHFIIILSVYLHVDDAHMHVCINVCKQHSFHSHLCRFTCMLMMYNCICVSLCANNTHFVVMLSVLVDVCTIICIDDTILHKHVYVCTHWHSIIGRTAHAAHRQCKSTLQFVKNVHTRSIFACMSNLMAKSRVS